MLKKFLFSQLFPNILLITLGVTPLLSAQNQYGFEYPKVLFFICLVLGLLILSEFSPRLIRHKLFAKSFLTIGGICFICTLTVASIFGQNLQQSILGQYPYYQGICLYLFLFVFALLVYSIRIPLKKYSYAFVLSGTWIAWVALWQWIELHLLGMPIATYSGRVVSTFGQPNLYSGYLAMVLPFFFFLMEKENKMKKIILGVLAGVVFLGIAVSMSRLSLILVGIFAGISVLFFLYKSKYFIKVAIVMGVLAMFFSILALPKVIQTEFIDPFNYTWLKVNNPEKRVYIWQVAISQGIKRPILGYGVDSFRDVYASYFVDAPKEASYYSRKVLVVDRAHNYLLDLFVYAGVVGVALWLLLVGNTLIRLRKNRWLLLAFILYFLFVLVHPQSVVHLMFFWFLAGIAAKSEDYVKEKGSLQE